jgi:hypothetical protein
LLSIFLERFMAFQFLGKQIRSHFHQLFKIKTNKGYSDIADFPGITLVDLGYLKASSQVAR